MNWPPRLAREAVLRGLEIQIAAEPETIAPRTERARLLAELGRTQEAREAFLEVLAQAPADRIALNGLGALLQATGYRTAARTAYAEAAARHPADPVSHVNLASALYENGELGPAHHHYEAALRCSPECAEAHRGLSYVLAAQGDAEGAAWHRRKGFEHGAVWSLPYRGEGPPVSLLLLISAAGGDVRMLNFLDDRVFETIMVAPEFYDLHRPLPRHRLVVNAIGDTDLSGGALAAAQSLIAFTSAPVLNAPAAVMKTGRAGNAERLSRVPGVVSPITVTLPRELFSATSAAEQLARHGLKFPLLLRTPGFHTGRHFVRVECARELAQAAADLPGAELMAIQYLDSRRADGKVRKYRVMVVGRRLYPLHVAISSNWKVHYFTAEMGDSAEHRAEDADFLENMPAVLGRRAMTALEQIQNVLGLDYAGIDFGLSPAGEVLLFEANATMVVNPPDPDERWSYRRPAVERIYAAVRQMLLEKAG